MGCWRHSTFLSFSLKSAFSLHRMASTIFALSSGPPPAAIAVIRISGSQSELALRNLTRKQKPFKPLYLFYTPIFGRKGRLLDNAMACFMKGPRTFTGEDSAELYLHGSRAVIQLVCQTLAEMPGLEAARAGEFTRRAFYNGKMDITQIEALGDLLQADTDSQLSLCHAQTKIGKYLRPTMEKLIKLLAKMEARIDFAEDLEDIDRSLWEEFREDIYGMTAELRRFLREAKRGQLIRSGMNVALIGRPNVGKSSLMNRLAKRELAIVSNISGTTRDCLESRLQLDGHLVNIVDTAGIRIETETTDPIEREGIRRTLERAANSHLIILVLEPTAEGICERGIENFLAKFDHQIGQQKIIICVNKADLIGENEFERRRLEKVFNPEGHYDLVWTCCLREDGLNSLLKVISTHLENGGEIDGSGGGSEVFLSRERHIQCLERAIVDLEKTKEILIELDDPALAAHHIQCCADSLGEIAGMIVHEQVLDSIFSHFCIGK